MRTTIPKARQKTLSSPRTPPPRLSRSGFLKWLLPSLGLVLGACGGLDDPALAPATCGGTCETEPASTPAATLITPLVECAAAPAEEGCTGSMCHDQFSCTVMHAPAGMRWELLALRIRPRGEEEGASRLTALLDHSQITFREGAEKLLELGTLARRESYTVEIEAYLADMGATGKVHFNPVAATTAEELTAGGDPVSLYAPCGAWAVTLVLPEGFGGTSARVEVDYPLAMPGFDPVLVDRPGTGFDEEQYIEVRAAVRLSAKTPEIKLILPVAPDQEEIPAKVTARPSQTTSSISLLPGVQILPR